MSRFITGADRERIQAHLREGEKILWCGRPESGWWSREILFVIQGGLAVLLIALSLILYGDFVGPCVEYLLPLLVAMGVFGVIGAPTVRWLHRRRWLYALTTQRALLLLHNELREYPLYPYMTERTHTPEQGLGDIVFERKKIMSLGKNEERFEEYGFLSIRESATVLRLLHEQIERQDAAER